jgi:hypothetical protein
MELHLLIDYLSFRDNVNLNIERQNRLVKDFESGIRNLQGVQVNNNGFPIWDDQEPEKGFLNDFISWNIKFKESKIQWPKSWRAFYIPSEDDYDYFMDFYGEGGIRSICRLHDVSFAEFAWASLNFQRDSDSLWFEFGSIQREMTRDQLLHEFGEEPQGYIFSPIHRYCGIEHMQVY